MRALKANLRICSLLLAGFVFSAHLVIPHDHHINDSVSNSGISCGDSHENAKKHHGFPTHCHAFNDLLAEKIHAFDLTDQVQNVKSDIVIDFRLRINHNALPVYRIIPGYVMIPGSADPEPASLRAPPSVS